jgi:nicotinamide mononucleotide (NMN) deamidase PncC
MAINLQNQSLSKISLSSRQMKDCFNSYKDKYKKTHLTLYPWQLADSDNVSVQLVREQQLSELVR